MDEMRGEREDEEREDERNKAGAGKAVKRIRGSVVELSCQKNGRGKTTQLFIFVIFFT